MVAEPFARVLDLSPEFATQGNDAMFERQELLKDAENEIAANPDRIMLPSWSPSRYGSNIPLPRSARLSSPICGPCRQTRRGSHDQGSLNRDYGDGAHDQPLLGLNRPGFRAHSGLALVWWGRDT